MDHFVIKKGQKIADATDGETQSEARNKNFRAPTTLQFFQLSQRTFRDYIQMSISTLHTYKYNLSKVAR